MLFDDYQVVVSTLSRPALATSVTPYLCPSGHQNQHERRYEMKAVSPQALVVNLSRSVVGIINNNAPSSSSVEISTVACIE